MQFILIKIPKYVHLHKEMLDSVKWRGEEKGGSGEGKLVILSQQQPK